MVGNESRRLDVMVTYHVSYGEPRSWYQSMHRSICQSLLGRVSIEYRSILGRDIDRQSVEYWLSISRVSIYTSADMCVDRYGCNLVDARPIPHQHFTDSLPIPYRYSVDTWSVYDLKSIWRRTCQKKGVFRFRIFFFVDITRMLYQVLGVVVFQLTRTIVIEHIECNKGS